MYQCPRDHKPLEEVRQDRQHRCRQCLGNLVISPKLNAVVKERFHEVKSSKRLQCPVCKFRMKHYRFKTRHLDIDGCQNCSTYWFDHGEMQAINDYIARYHKQASQAVGQGVKGLQTEEQKFYQEYMAHQGFEGDLGIDKVLVQVFLGLPAEHNLPPFRKPVVTYALVALNILVLIYAFVSIRQWGFSDYGFKPADPNVIFAFSAMFIHGSIMHLIGNIYILKVLGDNVEDLMGRTGFLLMYLASGLGGWAAALLMCPHPDRVHIGASGAVAGVMAAYFYLFPKMKFSFRFLLFFNFNVTSKAVAILWLVHQMMVRASGTNVAWDAHLGGFVVGLGIAFWFKKAHLL